MSVINELKSNDILIENESIQKEQNQENLDDQSEVITFECISCSPDTTFNVTSLCLNQETISDNITPPDSSETKSFENFSENSQENNNNDLKELNPIISDLEPKFQECELSPKPIEETKTDENSQESETPCINSNSNIDLKDELKMNHESETRLDLNQQELGIEDRTNPKKRVKFGDVKLYLFERKQGFSCIPSDPSLNSITIGMDKKHSVLELFNSQEEFFIYKREFHLTKLEEMVKNYERVFKKLFDSNDTNENSLSPFGDEELQISFEEFQKMRHIIQNKHEYSNIETDLPINMEQFCPILSLNERRKKLIELDEDLDQQTEETELSLNEIDEEESKEINEIRKSREKCGCDCKSRNNICSIDNGCSCAINGIKCQLDKTKFPCSCTLKNCTNPNGIKKFDQREVLKHYKNVLKNVNKESNEVKLEETVAIKSQKKRKRKRNGWSNVKSNKKTKTI